MTLRPGFAAAFFLCAAAGCATLPFASDDIAQCKDSNNCTASQDGGADASFGFDGGPTGEAGAVPLSRSTLCAGTECKPDEATSCKLDGGTPDAATTLACHMSIVSGSQTEASCQAAGTGNDGAECTTSDDCAPAFECVGTGTCRHYCCDDGKCTEMSNSSNYNKYFCDVASEKVGIAKVPVCEVIQPCEPLAPNACGPSKACTLVEIDNATKVVATCDETGPGVLNDSCEIDHCAAGFACIGTIGERTCQELCDTTHPCPQYLSCNMKSQALSTFNVGLCGY